MGQLIGCLIAVAVVIAVVRLIWPFIVIGIAVYLVIKIVTRLAAQHDKADAARRAAHQALRDRADSQHSQVLRGDPAGVYGRYPVPDLGKYNPTLWVCNQPLKKAFDSPSSSRTAGYGPSSSSSRSSFSG